MSGKFRMGIALSCFGAWLVIPATVRAQDSQSNEGWAVLRYQLHGNAPLEAKAVTAVRASSQEFAGYARAEMARRENEATAARNKRPETALPDLAPALNGDRELLFVSPRSQCVALHSHLTTRVMQGERPAHAEVVYFRATTDGAGRVVSLDVLYSQASEPVTRRLVAFGEENLKISARDNSSTPLEAYGSLRLASSGNVAYMVEAGGPLF